MNNAVLIQHVYTRAQEFIDMSRLTYQRHAAYASAHKMDYWNLVRDYRDLPIERGGWAKVRLIQQALKDGYEHVIWLDADAAIMNFAADLREALPTDASIGAVLHDPKTSQYLRDMRIDPHLNVGVLYAKRGAADFVDDWLFRFDGPLGRFLEQQVFNDMSREERYAGVVARVDDTWNATISVNMVEQPNVIGWHGVFPNSRRLAMMQATLKDDFLRFRV
jgi:hypothetical protein